MTRLLLLPIIVVCALLSTAITLIRAQTYDDQTIRDILLPADCAPPCFMGIRPGLTRAKEAYALLTANPWVGDISSHIDAGCCTIALNWKWNGKQPVVLEGGENTIYLAFNPTTGEQIVQDIALHTHILAGDAVLLLGGWPAHESGALQGLNKAFVEAFYSQQRMHLTATVPCPLAYWRLWQAPITMAMSKNSRGISGMKPMNEVC
ncbi:MAG: hypothetical protein GC179_15390 [Anaerolineaceae bacterium]|nr:hypothetical protein [Anaerolineaceae bacterium]